MTDIHTHILSGIDDGAADETESFELINLERVSGVRRIVFTPHFNFERQDLEEFIHNRAEAYRKIATLPKDVAVKLGAEVFFSPKLCEQDIRPLCIQDTNYILIELDTAHYPFALDETLYRIQLAGYTPILAHVERYSYLSDNPKLLHHWVEKGWVAQINAGSLFHGCRQRKLVMGWIKKGLVQVVASDVHSVQKRRPCLDKAMMLIGRRCGAEVADRLIDNSKRVFDGDSICIGGDIWVG
ncbi:MAG: CpsB/CapC family capsule biosynthesis tyrosine phosphatase [Angelakisella sp.]